MTVDDRRRVGDRRHSERRAGVGRRTGDVIGQASPLTFFWALVGALVVLYLFFVAIGGVEPDAGSGWTIAALVLAVLWLAHSWRRLWFGGASPRSDRERRGF
jgi:cell division protein FtsW (lipid II flippase)